MTLWNPMNAFSGQSRPVGDETVCVLRSVPDRRPARPEPGQSRDRHRRRERWWCGRPRRPSPPSDRLRSSRGADGRDALPHRDLVQAAPRAAARERRARSGGRPGAGTVRCLEVGSLRRRRRARASPRDAAEARRGCRSTSVRSASGASVGLAEETAAVTDPGESNVVDDAEVVAQAADDLEPAEAVAEEDAPAITATESIPFYKREIGFGRKRTTPEEAATVTAVSRAGRRARSRAGRRGHGRAAGRGSLAARACTGACRGRTGRPDDVRRSRRRRAQRGSGGRGRGDGSGLGRPSR